jgi:hypothetical protein
MHVNVGKSPCKNCLMLCLLRLLPVLLVPVSPSLSCRSSTEALSRPQLKPLKISGKPQVFLTVPTIRGANGLEEGGILRDGH